MLPQSQKGGEGMKPGDIVKCITPCSVLTSGKDYKIESVGFYHLFVKADDGIVIGVPPVYFGVYNSFGNPEADRLKEHIAILKKRVNYLETKLGAKNNKIKKVQERKREVYLRFLSERGPCKQPTVSDVFINLAKNFPALYSMIPKEVVEWAERNNEII